MFPGFKGVAGDVHDPTTIPSVQGIYVISWVLHNWPNSAAQEIVANVAKQALPGSLILIHERCTDLVEKREPDVELQAMLYFGGRERTSNTYISMLKDCHLMEISSTTLSNGWGIFA